MELNFDKIGNALKDVSEKAVKTGKEYKDILSIKAEISTCKELIERDYLEIGKQYYEMYADDNKTPEFDKAISEIKNATKAISELEVKIEEIKSNM